MIGYRLDRGQVRHHVVGERAAARLGFIGQASRPHRVPEFGQGLAAAAGQVCPVLIGAHITLCH